MSGVWRREQQKERVLRLTRRAPTQQKSHGLAQPVAEVSPDSDEESTDHKAR
jgi:hypothetical protein